MRFNRVDSTNRRFIFEILLRDFGLILIRIKLHLDLI